MAVFVNLSSHPSSTWGPEQITEASKFGLVKDIQFPVVDPNATSYSIKSLAARLVSEVQGLAAGQEIILHVMGEMSLVHAIVNLAWQKGIRSVCSTTERISIEDPTTGIKTSQFKFVQFRPYCLD